MSENSWPESNSFSELEAELVWPEPVTALGSDEPIGDPAIRQISDGQTSSESQPLSSSELGGFRRRRLKAALVLASIWAGMIGLHWLSWGGWLMSGLTLPMAIHVLRLFMARPMPLPKPLSYAETAETTVGETVVPAASMPHVSIMVAAKNEEAVIGRLVQNLCQLDYPCDRYDLWVIDDSSTDRTPLILQQLVQQFPQLHIFNRPQDAIGGKSGALNQVLPLTHGEIIVVFDADAQVEPDFLRRVLPYFDRPDVGAVQARKVISQAESASPEAGNFWIVGQSIEMALDAFIHQQRAALGGLGELRGNGQCVRRTALEDCGGWNEETITDDLDLTFRLHLKRWDIEVTTFPVVYEEGVTTALALWHQRNRWAEGGYQRYLDYGSLILKNQMGSAKTLDLLVFWVIQYVMPTAAIPDFLMAVVRQQWTLTTPLSALALLLFLCGVSGGLNRVRQLQTQGQSHLGSDPTRMIRRENFIRQVLWPAIPGSLYMLHWFAIVSSTLMRMSVRPKRLKWVKTIHQGETDPNLSTQPLSH